MNTSHQGWVKHTGATPAGFGGLNVGDRGQSHDGRWWAKAQNGDILVHGGTQTGVGSLMSRAGYPVGALGDSTVNNAGAPSQSPSSPSTPTYNPVATPTGQPGQKAGPPSIMNDGGDSGDGWSMCNCGVPSDLGSLPAGSTKMGADGYWYHRGAAGQLYKKMGAGAVKRVGAGYTPETGNYVVDAATAEQLVADNGGWQTIPSSCAGCAPPMVQEAQRYLNTSPSNDIYIYCSEDQMIYLLTSAGTLTEKGSPGAGFDPAAPPGVICNDPMVWDPLTKKCVNPAAPSGGVTRWWQNLSTIGKVGVVVGGAAVLGLGGWGVYKATEYHKPSGRR